MSQNGQTKWILLNRERVANDNKVIVVHSHANPINARHVDWQFWRISVDWQFWRVRRWKKSVFFKGNQCGQPIRIRHSLSRKISYLFDWFRATLWRFMRQSNAQLCVPCIQSPQTCFEYERKREREKSVHFARCYRKWCAWSNLVSVVQAAHFNHSSLHRMMLRLWYAFILGLGPRPNDKNAPFNIEYIKQKTRIEK